MRIRGLIRRRSVDVATLGFILALSFWMNWGSLRARLGPIDDHELATFLGPDKSLSFWNIPFELFTNTEVGSLGSSPRFRWGFYLLRLIEVSLFRDNAGLMYLIQTIVIASSAFVSFLIVKSVQENLIQDEPDKHNVSFVSSYSIPLATSIWFLSTPSLTAGFTRIGIQEPTLVLGLLLAVYGLIRVIVGPSTSSRAAFFIIAAGATLASGSKENGYVVVIPLLLGFFYSSGKVPFRQLCLPLCISAISILLVIYHNIRVLLRGSDQYGTTKSSGGMFSSLIDRTNNHAFLIVLLCVLLLASMHARIKSPTTKAHLFVVLFCLFLHLSESIFYGEDSVVTRYHAVSNISLILSVALTIQSVLMIMSPSSIRTSLRHSAQFPMVAFLLMIYLYPAQVFDQNREGGYSLARSTIEYQTSVDNLSVYLKAHQANSLVVYLFDTAADGEPAVAMMLYLRMNGVKNQFYLSVREIDEVPSATLSSFNKLAIGGSGKLGIGVWSDLVRSNSDACFSPTFNIANSAIPESAEIEKYCGYVG